MTAAIVVVDDSLTVRMDLVEAFEGAGHRAIGCADLASARVAIANEEVATVILDLLLPDGDGLDFLEELRGSHPAVPVLLLSSESEVKDRIRGLKHGADDYVGKPYDAGYVVSRVRELLRGSRADPTRALVLIIDDSATFREFLGRGLEEAGYDVVIATNGEEGLRTAANLRPQAVLVDSVMSGIDGPTVIRRIRFDSALRGMPCILLTASDDRAAELGAFEAGADAFVRKEADLEIVLARLAAVIRGAKEQNEETASLLGPKRILAVDDSATYREELASMLRGEGYDVVLARSGEEALEMLAVQPVDCILLDLVMPGLDGKETCRRIKGSHVVRDIPLIMITALEERTAMLEGLSTGADDFIAKSSDLDVIKARVRAQLRRKQFEDEHRKVREDLLRSELEAAEQRTQREVAEARAALVEELEFKNQELEAFSYSVSHDLRAPLRAIDGFSEALIEDCGDSLDERGKDYLRRVRASAKRMSELIDDLLSLSRISRAEMRRVQADMTGIANEVADAIRAREPTRDASFVVEPGLAPNADPRLLKVILENLMANAWKFTSRREGGRVDVGMARDKEGEIYFVRDNGAGFDMNYAKKLFVPFQRLHTEREYPGTGIGLATVRRVIDRHGGRVWAEGKVGEGATFYFTLPQRARG